MTKKKLERREKFKEEGNVKSKKGMKEEKGREMTNPKTSKHVVAAIGGLDSSVNQLYAPGLEVPLLFSLFKFR